MKKKGWKRGKKKGWQQKGRKRRGGKVVELTQLPVVGHIYLRPFSKKTKKGGKTYAIADLLPVVGHLINSHTHPIRELVTPRLHVSRQRSHTLVHACHYNASIKRGLYHGCECNASIKKEGVCRGCDRNKKKGCISWLRKQC